MVTHLDVLARQCLYNRPGCLGMRVLVETPEHDQG